MRTIRALADAPPQVLGDVRRSTPAPGERRVQRIVGVSARTVTDETIWEMLAQLFDPENVHLESVGSAYLSVDATGGDAMADAGALPDLACVVAVPPGGLVQARYICRRLRAKLPKTPILVIRPGAQTDGKESSQRPAVDGAGHVCFSLAEARTFIERQLLAAS